jgi:nucleoid DNA-binding protein
VADMINRRSLSTQVATRLGMRLADVDAVVQETLEVIGDQLAQGRQVVLRNFGTFEARPMAAAVRRRPDTGEQLTAPPSTRVLFRGSGRLKDRVHAGAPHRPPPDFPA